MKLCNKMYKQWKIDIMKISRNGANYVRESLNKWMSINMFTNKSFLLIHIGETKYFMRLRFSLRNCLAQQHKTLSLHFQCKESNSIWRVWFNNNIFNKTTIQLYHFRSKTLTFLMSLKLTIKLNKDKKRL